jgi:hypothetical protein
MEHFNDREVQSVEQIPTLLSIKKLNYPKHLSNGFSNFFITVTKNTTIKKKGKEITHEF